MLFKHLKGYVYLPINTRFLFVCVQKHHIETYRIIAKQRNCQVGNIMMTENLMYILSPGSARVEAH